MLRETAIAVPYLSIGDGFEPSQLWIAPIAFNRSNCFLHHSTIFKACWRKLGGYGFFVRCRRTYPLPFTDWSIRCLSPSNTYKIPDSLALVYCV